MQAMNDMLYMWTKLNHTNLFMNESSSLFKKIQICFSDKKILILVCQKCQIYFVIIKKKKKVVFWREKLKFVLVIKKIWF